MMTCFYKQSTILYVILLQVNFNKVICAIVFVEDASMTPINRRNDCPKGTECVSENSNLIGFDSCNNVMRCVPTNGH